MTNKENIVLCFCKHPTDGLVKSRLAKDIGVQHATDVYKVLLRETLNNINNASYKIILYCYPDTNHPFIGKLNEKYSLTIESQCKGNLGDKMYHAIDKHLNERTNIVLVGTDCLEINTAYIKEAFKRLNEGNNIVLGPTQDGGYGLIALNQLHKSMFDQIDWSTDKVLQQTKTKACELNWNISCLPIIRDLDVLDDYKYFSTHKKYNYLFN